MAFTNCRCVKWTLCTVDVVCSRRCIQGEVVFSGRCLLHSLCIVDVAYSGRSVQKTLFTVEVAHSGHCLLQSL